MRITDLLKNESIVLGASPADKAAAINQLADLMEAGGNLSDKEQYTKDVFAREASGTTGLGDGIATPHAKSAGVKAAGLAAMTVPAGMDFESMDGLPSRLFFMIAAPDSANDDHLAILSKLATMIMDPDFKEALIAAKNKDDFAAFIHIGVHGDRAAGFEKEIHKGSFFFVFIDCIGLNPEPIERNQFALWSFSVDVIDVFHWLS